MTQQKDGLNDSGFEQAGGTAPEPRVRGGPGGSDLDGGTTGASAMTDGDRAQASSGQPGGDNPARPGGQAGGAASADMDAIGIQSARPGPMGESGGGAETGPAGNGSLASGTYNERGDVTGPDSPAGAGEGESREGEGQGDDLANRLGGGAGRGTGLTGAGGATGDLGADRSERSDASALNAAGAGGPSGGDPGGMGGVRAQGGTGTGRPPGGVSPVGSSNDRD
ncbi:MAG TPA: hypothetical protein VF631_01945 [Allosphingosinicella sp.]|jgi:hypothetical protein|uniref:hypothetical protein n=1 Tax=Allosphingosinicella sp. TaxID=2823234 RepID=UPI002F27BD89